MSLAPAAKRTAIASQTILLGSAVGQMLLNIALTSCLGRTLAPSEYGFFTLVTTLLTMSRAVLDLGLSSAIAREIAQAPGRELPLLRSMMGWHTYGGVALASCTVAVALQEVELARRLVLYSAALVLAVSAPSGLLAAFQVRQAQFGLAMLAFFGQAAVLVAVVAVRRMGPAPIMVAALPIAREAVLQLGTIILSARLLGRWIIPDMRVASVSRTFRQGATYALAAILFQVHMHSGVTLVHVMRGDAELGAYAAAFRPLNFMMTLPWILTAPLVPIFATSATTGTLRLREHVSAVGSVAMAIGAVAAMSGWILAPSVIDLLYGGRYVGPEWASIQVFRWLSVAFGAVCVSAVFATSLLAARRERALVCVAAGALVLNIGLSVILIPQYGMVATAIVFAATQFLALVATGLLVTRHIGRFPVSPAISRALAFALVAAIASSAIVPGAAAPPPLQSS